MALVALGSGAGLARSSEPLSMEISPLIEGTVSSTGTHPIAVELQNSGPDAKGMLHVSAGEFAMDYPVELPRGANKTIVTYPSLEYGNSSFQLITDRGRIAKEYSPAYGGNESSLAVLLISETPGEMAFIKGQRVSAGPGAPDSASTQVHDLYCRSENAPDRPVGYANLAAVILGTGSERLTNEQIRALRLYALSGGTLVFLGGTSAPVLSDERWQDLLPASKFETVNSTHSDLLAEWGQSEPPVFGMTTGVPKAGVEARIDGGKLIVANRTWGLGKVVYCAINPFEPPLNKWDGRTLAFPRMLRLVDSVRSANFLQNYRTADYNGFAPGSATITPSVLTKTRVGRSPVGGSVAEDPFSTTLPPIEKVFTLLGIYFIVVIPVNFLILRKLKRAEWAWVTAPLISLGFAGAFFASAQDLYAAKMSTSSAGLILGQQGNSEGLFVGSTQMFIPRSGRYDLKLSGVDSLAIVPTISNSFGFGRGVETADLNLIDIGQIIAPQMSANNLAFKAMEYRQIVPIGEWIDLSVSDIHGKNGTCTVRNKGPFTLRNVQLIAQERTVSLTDLPPGSEQSIKFVAGKTDKDLDPVAASITPFLSRSRGIALIGEVENFRPGPQIGNAIETRDNLKLAYFAKEALGPQ